LTEATKQQVSDLQAAQTAQERLKLLR